MTSDCSEVEVVWPRSNYDYWSPTWLGHERRLEMLIGLDLLQRIQRAITDGGSPAQLCIMRRIGTDGEYIFRVRHGEVHLDYPITVPPMDTAEQVSALVNWDNITGVLVAMSKLVVKPGKFSPTNPYLPPNYGYGRIFPCVLPPVV